MNLKMKTGTVGYNNKILVSDGKFSLGKNDKVNSLVLEPVISMPKVTSHKVVAKQTSQSMVPLGLHAHELKKKPNISHEDEKIALILFLASGFAIWNMFR